MVADEIGDVLHESAHIIVQTQRAVGRGGNSPVDQVDVEAAFEQLAHDAAVRLQIENRRDD